nr:vegetative cell wall protein gp1-like [Aegilops tauschii subsp. strangulata]
MPARGASPRDCLLLLTGLPPLRRIVPVYPPRAPLPRALRSLGEAPGLLFSPRHRRPSRCTVRVIEHRHGHRTAPPPPSCSGPRSPLAHARALPGHRAPSLRPALQRPAQRPPVAPAAPTFASAASTATPPDPHFCPATASHQLPGRLPAGVLNPSCELPSGRRPLALASPSPRIARGRARTPRHSGHSAPLPHMPRSPPVGPSHRRDQRVGAAPVWLGHGHSPSSRGRARRRQAALATGLAPPRSLRASALPGARRPSPVSPLRPFGPCPYSPEPANAGAR